jgi:hypothetical protein
VEHNAADELNGAGTSLGQGDCNSMVGAETMTGVNHHTSVALPHAQLREVLKKYDGLQ